jgi:hypothetical protein|tara:strand:+ start:2061 stop:2303 length:243 start_codon:yes stop_codon:yes gene_type:complete
MAATAAEEDPPFFSIADANALEVENLSLATRSATVYAFLAICHRTKGDSTSVGRLSPGGGPRFFLFLGYRFKLSLACFMK